MNYIIIDNADEYTDIGFNDKEKTRIIVGKGKNSAVNITQGTNSIKFPIEYLSLLTDLDNTVEKYNNSKIKSSLYEDFQKIIKEYNEDYYNQLINNDNIDVLYDDFFKLFIDTDLDNTYESMKFFFENTYELDNNDWIIELSKEIKENTSNILKI